MRQLLDQTSGLADQAFSELDRPQPISTTEAVASMSSAHLVAAPGTRWNYHDPNYHVAARLVEVLCGEGALVWRVTPMRCPTSLRDISP